ncbi:MAG: hypothetical protein NC429_07345 [Lachnospiraceae bacterium]|nr:hypothetical protein [Lachnospiraceae bacterium]
MKKIMKTLLMVIELILAGFGVYVLWDDYVQQKEQQKRALEAEERAAFIARRKARAREKAAERAANKPSAL